MTEPQDVLAEAIGSVELGFWRETPIEDPDGVHGIEARFDVRAFAEAITAALAARGYALVRTPETLDVERLRAPYGGHPEFGPRFMANQAQPSIAGWEALAKDALLAFDQARAALVRTPETLDVADGEAFALDVERSVIPHSLVEQIIEGTIGLRAATPAPDPGAALREAASRYRAAEWDIRCHEDSIRDEAHNARVEEWRSADAAIAVLLGKSSPFAPSAEPPETDPA